MDPVMQSLFGKMPISQIPSVQAAVSQKNAANTIFIMGAIIVISGIIIYNMDKKMKEMRIKLYTKYNEEKENF